MWAAIAGVIKAIAMALGMKERADAKKAGQQEQENATLKANADKQKEMSDANAAGPHTADDVDERLRTGRF